MSLDFIRSYSLKSKYNDLSVEKSMKEKGLIRIDGESIDCDSISCLVDKS
jgi:hypothetical protein